LAKGIVSDALDALTAVGKVVATGALRGAVDAAGATVAGGGNETKTKIAGVVSKSKKLISKSTTATNKKTKKR